MNARGSAGHEIPSAWHLHTCERPDPWEVPEGEIRELEEEIRGLLEGVLV